MKVVQGEVKKTFCKGNSLGSHFQVLTDLIVPICFVLIIRTSLVAAVIIISIHVLV